MLSSVSDVLSTVGFPILMIAILATVVGLLLRPRWDHRHPSVPPSDGPDESNVRARP